MRDVPASAQAYWNGRDHLGLSLDRDIVMKGDRIVVPESLRETFLADLHAAHQGLARTKLRAGAPDCVLTKHHRRHRGTCPLLPKSQDPSGIASQRAAAE